MPPRVPTRTDLVPAPDPDISKTVLRLRVAEFGLIGRDFMIGCGAAIFAVALRYTLDLPAGVLPFFTVVMAVCLVTVTTGLVGGVTAAVVGGTLSWYVILTPQSWQLSGSDGYALVGYFAVITVILCTSQLYRLSERNRQAAAFALAMKEVEQQTLFAREMSHRLKNAIAIVQSMATQTFAKDSPELPKFDGRLRALADAHGLLNEHIRQPHAGVAELVQLAIRPFKDHPDRFVAQGPTAIIPDQQVVSMALALHELGTNAVKYGALSTSQGWISINWRLVAGKIQLEWKEHDGPAVVPPSSAGFGTRLLRRTAMGADLQFEPSGLRCLISQRF